MKLVWIALVLAAACGSEDLAKKKAEMDKQAKSEEPPPKVAPPPSELKPTDTPKAAPKESGPEPTTPEELDKALKQAMIDGRDKDVIKYCNQLTIDDKTNPQSLLGCTLSACRTKDADSAHKFSKPLQKQYRDAATRVCAQAQIVL